MAPCSQEHARSLMDLQHNADMIDGSRGRLCTQDHAVGSARKEGISAEPLLVVVEEESTQELGAEEGSEERVLGRAVLPIWPFGQIELSLTEDPSRAHRKVRIMVFSIWQMNLAPGTFQILALSVFHACCHIAAQ
jgi:hypothetical protein